jgi:hypothetical protein
VDIPPSVQVGDCPSFCVVYFKDKNKPEEVEPHNYVIVPTTDESARLFIMITSKIKERKVYYVKWNPNNLKSLVPVNSAIFPFLSLESIINCNDVELINIKEELDGRVDPRYVFEVRTKEVPPALQKDIKEAIINSTIVRDIYKEMI